MSKAIEVNDLGRMRYQAAWELQERVHESVAGGGPETILIVEHEPVVTLGRRGETGSLISPPEELARQKIDFVHSDRGGDITYHAPGQIVAYPIIRLADHRLSVSGYVHLLEAIVIKSLAEMGIEGRTDSRAIGVWVSDGEDLAKIAAIGVRIRRGVSLHGLALNVDVDLGGFKHIVPCGLTGRRVTSIAKVLGDTAPQFAKVKEILIEHMLDEFGK